VENKNKDFYMKTFFYLLAVIFIATVLLVYVHPFFGCIFSFLGGVLLYYSNNF